MNIVERFGKVKILVVGDVMLDKYLWGSVTRISPEAPVPIVNLNNTTLAVGGAANVASNTAGLGAETFLIGVVGDDECANELCEMLQKINVSPDYLIRTTDRVTTLKTRVMAHNQQVVRIDQETNESISEFHEQEIWDKVLECIEKVNIVIISDYSKGMLTETFLTNLIELCKKKNITILVDPKGNDFAKYQNADILTPNRKEAFTASDLLDTNSNQLEVIGDNLLRKLNLKALLITLGEDGISLFQPQQETKYLKALARHVYDVTGAGDTVIATLGVAIGAGFSLSDAAEIANVAAGFVVEEIGTTSIEMNKLRRYFEELRS